MSGIKTVFFDAAGTLFDVRGSVGEIYARVARKHGIEADAASLEEGFRRAFPHQPPLAFAPGTPELELFRLEKDWWRRLVREVFAGEAETERFDDFFDDVFDLFRTPVGWTLYDDTHPTLAALSAQGFRVGLISNFDSRVHDVLRAFDLEGYFSTIHISSRVGAAKPDVAIFHASLAAHGIQPYEAVYVGDSLRDDAWGAAAAGLRAVWLDRANRAADFPLHITRLTELIRLVAAD